MVWQRHRPFPNNGGRFHRPNHRMRRHSSAGEERARHAASAIKMIELHQRLITMDETSPQLSRRDEPLQQSGRDR